MTDDEILAEADNIKARRQVEDTMRRFDQLDTVTIVTLGGRPYERAVSRVWATVPASAVRNLVRKHLMEGL